MTNLRFYFPKSDEISQKWEVSIAVTATCNSDSRYADRPHMNGVFFIPFPKPKCKIWIKNCGRKDFGIDRISRNTYVCSKHFVGEKGPTNDHPHPVPAAASDLERRIATKVVRPPPRDRSASLPPCKKQKTKRRRMQRPRIRPSSGSLLNMLLQIKVS